jgi:hypothetical protein
MGNTLVYLGIYFILKAKCFSENKNGPMGSSQWLSWLVKGLEGERWCVRFFSSL